jgi:hypothetical protein
MRSAINPYAPIYLEIYKLPRACVMAKSGIVGQAEPDLCYICVGCSEDFQNRGIAVTFALPFA